MTITQFMRAEMPVSDDGEGQSCAVAKAYVDLAGFGEFDGATERARGDKRARFQRIFWAQRVVGVIEQPGHDVALGMFG